jgi:hypothetical protein
VPGRAHLCEQPVRRGELAPRGRSVAGQAVLLCAFDMDVGPPELSPGLINELRHLGEEGLDRLTGLSALKLTQTANVHDRGLALGDRLALPLGDRDGFRGNVAGSLYRPSAEERTGVRREDQRCKTAEGALSAPDLNCLLGAWNLNSSRRRPRRRIISGSRAGGLRPPGGVTSVLSLSAFST